MNLKNYWKELATNGTNSVCSNVKYHFTYFFGFLNFLEGFWTDFQPIRNPLASQDRTTFGKIFFKRENGFIREFFWFELLVETSFRAVFSITIAFLFHKILVKSLFILSPLGKKFEKKCSILEFGIENVLENSFLHHLHRTNESLTFDFLRVLSSKMRFSTWAPNLTLVFCGFSTLLQGQFWCISTLLTFSYSDTRIGFEKLQGRKIPHLRKLK